MRSDPVPLTNRPAHQFDQCTVDSAIAVMELMAEHGCQYLDAFGLWATRAYPVDIVSAFQDSQRQPLLDKLCKAADPRFWDIWKIPPRCEWKLSDALFGTSPAPAM